MAILEIDRLEVRYKAGNREARAVDGISFSIERGECLGLVGESGCGKSTVAKAIMGILPPGGRITAGEIRYDGVDIVALPEAELRKRRWRDIALVPQTAMNGFDPVYRIDQQLDETIRAHEQMPSAERQRKLKELFQLVDIHPDRLKNYPHEFSGGMRQRAMIAMSLLLDPKVIVADEPTTGLDVLVQDQIMQRIKAIQEQSGKAMLLITHDMALVAENCERVAVMYAGRIMEMGGVDVMQKPYHPYTLGLRNAFPDMTEHRSELIAIPGMPPSLIDPPQGCRFRARCPFATELCLESPPLYEVAAKHFVACHYVDQVDVLRARASDPATWREPAVAF